MVIVSRVDTDNNLANLGTKVLPYLKRENIGYDHLVARIVNPCHCFGLRLSGQIEIQQK